MNNEDMLKVLKDSKIGIFAIRKDTGDALDYALSLFDKKQHAAVTVAIGVYHNTLLLHLYNEFKIKTEKDYPKLLSTLCKFYSKREAISLIEDIGDTPISDHSEIAYSFSYSDSTQGCKFWMSVEENIQQVKLIQQGDEVIEKEYPQLINELCNIYSKEGAILVIKGIGDTHKMDNSDIRCSFMYMYSEQGYNFWIDVEDKINKAKHSKQTGK